MQSNDLAVVKKAGLVSLSRVINLLGLLITTIILARYLTKAEFASYDQMWLIFNTITPIISFAFTSSIYFFGAKERSSEYIKSVFLFLTVVGLFLGVSLFLFSHEISSLLNNPHFATNLLYFAPFLIFSIPSLTLDAILILKTEFKKLFLVTALTVLSYLTVVIFTVLLERDIFFIFSGLSIISFARFVYSGYEVKKSFGCDFKTCNFTSHLKEILAYTTPLMLGHISASLSRQVDKYIIANNFPAELYAIYTVGAKELPLVPLVTSSFISVIFPEISKLYGLGENSKIANLINNVIRTTSLIIIPIFSYLLFFSKEFVLLLFSEKYVESVAIFRIYLFFLPVRVLLYSPILSALGRQKIYMLVSIFDLILNASLGVILVKIFGMPGSAIAVIVSTYFETFLMLFLIMKALSGVKFAEILPVKFVLLVLVSTLALSFLCYFVGIFIENLILRLFLTSGLFAGAYLFGLRFTIFRKKI